MHNRRLLEGDQVGGIPPAGGDKGKSRTRGGDSSSSTYMSEANFDTNMVIILAALLCALIFALGLNSIVRCALRCSRRFALDLETPQQAAARLAATGLKKRELRKIPVAVYGSSGTNTTAGTTTGSSSSTSSGHVVEIQECAICLGEFVDGDRVRVLPKCNHSFHVTCVDTWLLSHSSCPNCRHSLLLDKEKEREAAASSL